MSVTCPACKKTLDPAHAPVARVRGARVVSFCSEACADGTPLHDEPEVAAEPEPEADSQVAARAPGSDAVPPLVDDSFDDITPPPPGQESDVDSTDIYLGQPRKWSARGRRRIVAISGAILVGGMAVAIIEAVSPSTPATVSASKPPPIAAPQLQPVSAPELPDVDTEASDVVNPDRLVKAAIAELRELSASTSARVGRIAAMALARTGDEAACERLGKLLDSETSQLNRVAIAYAMARADKPRGRAILVKAIGHKRRDVRLDAAKSLVKLGDDTGRTTLYAMLRLRGYRIGAAALLARLGDERGLEALRAAVALPTNSPETKMRAAVALGSAGDASVKEKLEKILVEGRYNVGAAIALATLGDRKAVPHLARQLERNAMRVQAALALVRLNSDIDLTPLAVALASEDEVARVSAAEAILVLAGPKEWSVRD